MSSGARLNRCSSEGASKRNSTPSATAIARALDGEIRRPPLAIETVLEMVGQKSSPKVQLFDNAIVDRLAQEGFIDRLYKGGKS